MISRNTTPSEYIYYGLHLYFSGLSLRRVSERLSCFIKRNHVPIWNWIQKHHPRKISSKRKTISEFKVDETLRKVRSEYIWLWVATEPSNKEILALSISKERNTFVAERFLSGRVKIHGTHSVSTDGGTWYPKACRLLKLDHHANSHLEKSLIERTMQYTNDRTESFDDYFLCRKKNYKLRHVKNWMRFLVDYHNSALESVK